MRVLYHGCSPLDHLLQLKSRLVKGRGLVLDRLVIEGDVFSVLVPKKHFSQMRMCILFHQIRRLRFG